MQCLKPLDERIVLFGQSCVGKTTFALQVADHGYRCFDALFPWHLIETLGLSISAALEHVREACGDGPFVLDGWHLADRDGLYLPVGACVYVVYAPYQTILRQYRVPVTDPLEYWPMYQKWYAEVTYGRLPGVRYFLNTGEFRETSSESFLSSLRECSRGTVGTSGTQGSSMSSHD